MHAAGLSANKLAAIRDLTDKVLSGAVDLAPGPAETDEEIIARLSSVRGIGPWTAEMFLMTELRRLDVWPTEDLGVRRGFALAWGLDPAPKPKQLLALGEPFRPYRTIVAHYCWQALYQGASAATG